MEDYSTQDLCSILTETTEPAQMAILLALDLESLDALSSERTQIGQMIRSPYLLGKLAIVHNLPLAEDYEQFLAFSRMPAQDLLKYSAEHGYTRIVQAYLYDKKLDLNWDSVLAKASKGGHLEIVELLLKQIGRAAFDAQTLDNAVGYASRSGHLEVIKSLYEYSEQGLGKDKIRQSLTQASAKAASLGHIEIIRYLNEIGYYDREWALQSAAISGEKEMILLLLTDDLRVKDESQIVSALEYALMNGRTEIVKILVEEIIALSDAGTQIEIRFQDLDLALKRIKNLEIREECQSLITILKDLTG